MSLLENAIREKVKLLKEALGNRCSFCENTLEGSAKEISFLALCEICHGKYELNKRLIEEREINGDSTRWKDYVKLIRDFFFNRCFFCERDYIPKTNGNGQIENEEVEFLFPLCNASCSQKYKVIEVWRKRLAAGLFV